MNWLCFFGHKWCPIRLTETQVRRANNAGLKMTDYGRIAVSTTDPDSCDFVCGRCGAHELNVNPVIESAERLRVAMSAEDEVHGLIESGAA